jgi:hypothetical protein
VASGAAPASIESRQDVFLVKHHEAFRVRADLVDVDMVEAGVDVFLNHGDMPLGIWPADNLPGDRILGDQPGRLLEVGRHRQFLVELARNGRVRPNLERRLSAFRLAFCPADRNLPGLRLSLAA